MFRHFWYALKRKVIFADMRMERKPIIVFLFFQKYIFSGVTSGAVK